MLRGSSNKEWDFLNNEVSLHDIQMKLGTHMVRLVSCSNVTSCALMMT